MTVGAPRVMTRTQQGFTLIEVLVALGVFAIVLVSVPGVVITTIKSNSYARRISAATNFARDKIEVIRNTPYGSVAGGSETGMEIGTKGVYTRSWTVTAGPTASTKKVAVTVSWIDQASHQIEVDALIGG
jgi:prepilin-type N-terminal cleavage/methylation domain-containing protein